MSRRVVVTGIGILSCLGRGEESTLKALSSEKSGISKISAFNTDRFASSRGGVVKDDLIDPLLSSDKYFDRATHLLHTVFKDALVSALLEGASLENSCVYLGTTLGGTISGQKFHAKYLLEKDADTRSSLLSDYMACNQAADIALHFGCTGEYTVVNNACASGANTIGLAFNRILRGEENLAFAGGYDVMSNFTFAGFNSLQLVTAEECRPFDRNRSGLLLGEGAAILVLEEYDHARLRGADIIAEVIGFGQTTDAYHLTKPDPEAKGAARAISDALKQAGIAPDEIDLVNAHGTGTPANDPMEAKALSSALGSYFSEVPVSSTKPFTGHTLGAAGAIEAAISIYSVNNDLAPVNLNYTDLDPDCDLNILRKTEKRTMKTVLSNSFGFGGSNAALLLRRGNE